MLNPVVSGNIEVWFVEMVKKIMFNMLPAKKDQK